ncbi:MAG: helix-turn-helix transcriptional regulator [Deltaproteobacteria bacterium]|nr:helix-turn-helix transcriptional regulator [Deltaproteobacteria bacterium]
MGDAGLEGLPPRLREWVERNTEPGRPTRRRLVELLHRILRGEKVTYGEVKRTGLYYQLRKMRRQGVLILVKERGPARLAVSPEYLE